MVDSRKQAEVYQFADFQLCSITERLSRNGEALKIEPQQYALLRLFISNPGVVISRDTIEQQVWAGRPVSDEAIRAAMRKLRELLQDDARSPRFIKTIPKQGYKWLAPVSLLQNNPKSRVPSKHKHLLSAVFFTVFFLVLIVYVMRSDEPVSGDAVPQAKITRLTTLTGSEVSAHYHPDSNKLAFVNRETRNSPQQLYVKNLNQGVVTRLSWDEANYSNAFWSEDGTKLAFIRQWQQTASFHIARFSADGTLKHTETINNEPLKDKFLLGWLTNDEGFLLAETMRPNKKHGIYAYSLQDQQLTALSQPNVSGRGDYKAALSPDGNQLAILREEVAQNASLLIIDKTSGDLMSKSALPFVPSYLAWHRDNQTIAMSNFFGEHGRFNIESKQLSLTPELPKNSLDIFATCGQQCYVLRQHNGNFLDLQETPLASITNQATHGSNKSQDSNHTEPSVTAPALLAGGRLLKLADAQDFPQYLNNDAGLFFVTLQDKHFVFQLLTQSNQVYDIATLDRNAQLSSVSVSPDNSQLAGSANGRLFIAPIQPDTSPAPVQFITGALERFENPVWSHEPGHLYVTQISGNQPEIVLLNVASLQKQTVVKGFAAFRLMPGSTDRAIAITPDMTAKQLSRQDSEWQTIQTLGKISGFSPNRWQVTQDALYFAKHELPESFLCRKALLSETNDTAEQCWSTGDNRFQLNFHINPSQQNIILVESLSAESDIIKMQW